MTDPIMNPLLIFRQMDTYNNSYNKYTAIIIVGTCLLFFLISYGSYALINYFAHLSLNHTAPDLLHNNNSSALLELSQDFNILPVLAMIAVAFIIVLLIMLCLTSKCNKSEFYQKYIGRECQSLV